MINNFWVCIVVIMCVACQSRDVAKNDIRPNIVLIVADDLGYSDLGFFGSEISTPNIDALATQGSTFTNFYTSATCSPTRAMLLTGTDNHIAGLGNMAENVPNHPEQVGQPGYEGYLNNNVVSVAELLRDSGYQTYATGKWHLGTQPQNSPYAKGFEKSFMLLTAYASHYYPHPGYNPFWENDDYGTYPEGRYSSEVYTDKLIGYLEKERKNNQPFFMYAAYTSPHWPLQAPIEFINKYKGTYDIGYDSLRIKRFYNLKSRGIISDDATIPQRTNVKGQLYGITDIPLKKWEDLSDDEKLIEARKMEIYAGMVENLDFHIGRLINTIKERGEYENTLIVFMSDNGAAILDANETPKNAPVYDYMGTYNSFLGYGPQWAQASSASNFLYKGYVAEGGIKTPMIIKMPHQKIGSGLHGGFSSVLDLAPSFLELAGKKYPEEYKGKEIFPLQGESLIKYLRGEKENIHSDDYYMGWELFGRYALRRGEWKITEIESPFGSGTFQLFNLTVDPGETTDLSKKHPEKYTEMISLWNEYVEKNGVILRQ